MAVLLQLLCCVAFTSGACLFANVTPDGQRLVAQLLFQLTATSIIPVGILFLRVFRKVSPHNPVGLLILLMPFALFVAELMFVAFIGHEDSVGLIRDFYLGNRTAPLVAPHARMLIDCITIVFLVIVAVEYAVLLFSTIRSFVGTKRPQRNLVSFFRGKGGLSTSWMLSVNLLLLFTTFFVRYLVALLMPDVLLGVLLDLLLSLAVLLTFYSGMFEAKETISLQDAQQAFRYNTIHFDEHPSVRFRYPLHTGVTYTPPPSHAASAVPPSEPRLSRASAPAMAPEQGVASAPPSGDTAESPSADTTAGTVAPAAFASRDVAESVLDEITLSDIVHQIVTDEDSLQRRFEEVMINDQLFLMPGITLTLIAERLNTNKTYLSRMINSTYNLAFPEYLNMLRIDYAEQYILHNRGVRQSEVAMACGFSSPSAFNNTFKKITGVTPKVWLATFDDKEKKNK